MITLSLVEYKDRTWGFVGRIPAKYRILRRNSVGQKVIDSVRFKNKKEASEAVIAVLVAGFNVRIYRLGEKR